MSRSGQTEIRLKLTVDVTVARTDDGEAIAIQEWVALPANGARVTRAVERGLRLKQEDVGWLDENVQLYLVPDEISVISAQVQY